MAQEVMKQMTREFFEGTWQQQRSFSPAVVTRSGRTIWVAGHGATHDDDGQSLAGNFEAQVHQAFKNVTRTQERAGATLQHVVSMTVHIIDARHGDRFVELRKQYFPNNFPASTLITAAGFAKPEMMVEITPVAVIDDE
jgi:enamine deaminase RidA (YjgF/YER057c/UK114 family)